jgi:hypothetical protein
MKRDSGKCGAIRIARSPGRMIDMGETRLAELNQIPPSIDENPY